MSNQQPTTNPKKAETSKTEGTANAENLRGKTEHVVNIDDAGFIPQATAQLDGDVKLSNDDFSDAPVDSSIDAGVKQQEAGDEEQAKEDAPETVALAGEVETADAPETVDTVDANIDAPVALEPVVDPTELESAVDDNIKAPTFEDNKDDLEEQSQIDLIVGASNEVHGISTDFAENVGMSYGGSNPLIRLALRLATLGVMVKSVNGDIDSVNDAQKKYFGSRTKVSNMLWTARIPSGGFGGMTGEIYLRSLRALVSEFDNPVGNAGIRAQFLIAPKNKSLDDITDVPQAYLDGTLISLLDAINSGAKISKHHIIVIITPSDENNLNTFSVESVVDPEVEGMYFLENTLEVLSPSLLAMTRYVGKIANDGHFAISIPVGCHYAQVEQRHPCMIEDDEGAVVEGILLEISEEYHINIIETDVLAQDVFNPIFATTQLLEIANSIVEGADVQRFTKSTARVLGAQSEHYSHIGGSAKTVTLSLTQAWDLDGDYEDAEDEE